MNTAFRSDVTVIGAGMVGSAAASLLARCGFSVSLVEGREPAGFDERGDYRLRVSALSPGSRAILGQAGAWGGIASQRHCPYRRMEIEDRHGHAGLAFDAPAFGLDELGVIVENDLVQHALWATVRDQALVQLHCPDRLASVEQTGSGVRVRLQSGASIESALLLGADGSESGVRKSIGIGQEVWEYNQKGLVCVVRKSRPNPGIAWQRFLDGGPLAFLPLEDGRSSIVWTRPRAEADRLLEMPDTEFMAELQAASEGWLGELEAVGPRAAFPLAMRLSGRHVSGRAVLLGDAAHVVHPLAGQGVNLGFADAAALVEVLAGNRSRGLDLAEKASLRRYERWRKSESGLMSWGVHGLGGLFGLDGLTGLRRFGMGLVGRSWFMKEAFVRRAAGLNRNAPALSRGSELKSLC